MNRSTRRWCFLWVVAVMTSSPFLRAQEPDFDIMSRWAQGNMIQQNLNTMLNAQQGRGRPTTSPRSRPGTAPLAGRSGTTAAGSATTAYRADPAVTARVQRQFVAFIRSTSGDAGAQEMQKAFAQKDLLHAWAVGVAPDGMKAGDVADALTEYWVANWQAANQHPESPSPAAYRAVRAQVGSVFATNPGLASLNNAQRQELAEVYIYNMLVQGEGYLQAAKQHNQPLLNRISQAAETRFRNEMHVELQQLTLDERGFRIKG